METTEKRELLIAFQRYSLNTQAESEIYDDDIESFLSALPDDGEKEAMTPLQERFKEAIDDNDCLVDYIANDHCILPEQYKELSIACEKIADEFAEGFYAWCIDKVHFIDSDGLNVMIETSERITHKQLLQQFKEERK